MKKFYTSSYWFWVVSKIIFVIMLMASIMSILGEGGRTDGYVAAINFLAFVEAVLLAITAVQDLTGRVNAIKVVSGTLLVLFGIALIVVLLTVSKGGQSALYALGYPFSLWMIGIGLFDLLRISK